MTVTERLAAQALVFAASRRDERQAVAGLVALARHNRVAVEVARRRVRRMPASPACRGAERLLTAALDLLLCGERVHADGARGPA